MAIRQEITCQMVNRMSWQSVAATLIYDPADPLAIRIDFTGSATWRAARDLVREGLHRPAGLGDVRFWPTKDRSDALFLSLEAPSGRALFELSHRAVSNFLARTDSLVPPGSEASRLGLTDDGLYEWLGGVE